MKCPVCKETNLVLSERQGIEIDYCPDCRGVWLDRGELDKIIEKSAASVAAAAAVATVAPTREERYDRHDESRKPYKRRKSFLEELFD